MWAGKPPGMSPDDNFQGREDTAPEPTKEAEMKPRDIYDQGLRVACRCDCGLMKPRGQEKGADLARRGFLCNAIAGAAMLAGTTVIRAQHASAQSTLTPETALKALMDGNQRYVAGQLQSLNEDLSLLKAKTAEKQEPFAAVLSCADSRVPVEFVFDQSIGQIFVVRVT
jgi:carbonic anhydrase